MHACRGHRYRPLSLPLSGTFFIIVQDCRSLGVGDACTPPPPHTLVILCSFFLFCACSSNNDDGDDDDSKKKKKKLIYDMLVCFRNNESHCNYE